MRLNMRVFVFLAAAALVGGMPAARLADGSVSLALENPAEAQSAGLGEAGFQAYLPSLRAAAARAGIRQDTLNRVFPNLSFSSRTVELDRAQPGGAAGSSATPPFAPYRARHVTQALIDRGRAR